jgi:elongation factor 1 alpha-like protein
MASHKRVKDIDYDEDDLYSGDEGEYDNVGGDGLTAEDKENFAVLTPVVRAELDEAGLQVENKEIQDALWHYYWDVAKSVTYLKNAKQPKTKTLPTNKEKTKSKFDQAQEELAKKSGGEFTISFPRSSESWTAGSGGDLRRATLAQAGRLTCAREDCSPPLHSTPPAGGWFANVSWSSVPSNVLGDLVPSQPERPVPKLLGGSSKLAKLAEERRKKAEAAKHGSAQPSVENETRKTTSALDRLTLGKSTDQKENASPIPPPEPRKYLARKRRESTPPPPEPEPEPQEEQEPLPDLRAPPTAFGRAIATCPLTGKSNAPMSMQDMLGSAGRTEAFQNPSPDDVVSRAQGGSKGLSK